MNGKRYSDKARKNGFYLALAVCLVAVGIAAWSTYDAVNEYVDTEEQEVEQAVENEQQDFEDDPDDPETYEDDPEDTEVTGNITVREDEEEEPEPSPVPTESPTPSPTPEPQIPVTAPLYEISSELIYPVVSGEASKAYSAGAPMYSETMRDWRIHAGTDFKAESGEDIISCGNGQVKETYTDAMLGNVVVIEHGEYSFFYCGLGENFRVQAGDIVTAGQVIGSVTAVPEESADAPHVHLEVKRDGVYLDPMSVLEGEN